MAGRRTAHSAVVSIWAREVPMRIACCRGVRFRRRQKGRRVKLPPTNRQLWIIIAVCITVLASIGLYAFFRTHNLGCLGINCYG